MALTQQNREIEIITPLGVDELLLQDVTVSEELGRLFIINAEVLSTENISFEDLLGQNVSIRLDLPEGERFFNGYVSGISQAVDEGHYARYNITIHPWLWFLTRTSDCKIFQNKTVPDIIKEVCNELGFTDIEDKLTASYRTWEYCVQYRETDFNFLSRLMEQEGIYYYFTHELGKHTLNLADGYGSHNLISGYAEIEYYPPDDTVVRDDKRINSWFLSKKIQPGAYVLTDYDFVKPKADLKVNSTVTKTHSESEHEIFDYPGEYIENGDGNNYVRTRIEELHAQYEQGQGEGIARGMMSGGLFSLANYPREDQNREYLVESVNHNIHIDAFEAAGQGGGAAYSNSFTVIESSTPYRPARITPKPIVQGPQTAVVVGPSGDEIYTDEHGQVKLQFHWDRYGESDENSSCWVRVSQLWAGKTWGGIHIPRIGQEVIVEFLEGDPDRPIITGRVYNGDQTPPYALPANKTQSGIKSRSSKGGSGANFNEIRFEDKMGEEQVYIHAEKNQDNIVENDETTSVGHDRTEDVGNDETISIGHDRTETVGNNETIGIGVDRIETVGSNETITIGSNRTVTIGSNKTETIAINKAETIGVAKELTIGAAYQVTVGAVMNETVAVSKTQQVGTTKSTTVGGNVTETYGASQTVSVSKDLTESFGKNQSTTVGDNNTVSVGKDQSITVGKNLVIDAGDSIVIKTGKASITMKKDGTIQIVGKDITVNGSGEINVKASKNITMKGKKILQN
ncbi:type VI secretion system Vgr family protein [Methyloprofundus sp.]|uniref:type VI secretion system Vgr family protein n=1 Tax=Methyloprofundus sp. TaxID=2020875 RepID=UPI003D113E4B